MAKTVSELISALQKFPGHLEVVLSRDEEGNGFNPWSGDIEPAVKYDEYGQGDYSGYAYDLDEDGYRDEDTERPVKLDEATAVILWP